MDVKQPLLAPLVLRDFSPEIILTDSDDEGGTSRESKAIHKEKKKKHHKKKHVISSSSSESDSSTSSEKKEKKKHKHHHKKKKHHHHHHHKKDEGTTIEKPIEVDKEEEQEKAEDEEMITDEGEYYWKDPSVIEKEKPLPEKPKVPIDVPAAAAAATGVLPPILLKDIPSAEIRSRAIWTAPVDPKNELRTPFFLLDLYKYQMEGLKFLETNSTGAALIFDMGLGKTCIVLSFICKTINDIRVALGRGNHDVSENPHLIVMPKSVKNSWINDFAKFIDPASGITMLCTGDKRPTPEQIQGIRDKKYNIVVIGYEQLRIEFTRVTEDLDIFPKKFDFMKPKSIATIKNKIDVYNRIPSSAGRYIRMNDNGMITDRILARNSWIFSQVWSTFILDEAHKIRNADTQTFLACCAVQALRRIFVTGTPLHNRKDDVYNAFRFIRAPSLASLERWAAMPDKEKSAHLAEVSKKYLLWKKKGDIEGITMVPMRIFNYKTSFHHPEEKKFYDFFRGQMGKLENDARKSKENKLKAGDVGFVSSVHIFDAILKARQACNAARIVNVSGLPNAPHIDPNYKSWSGLDSTKMRALREVVKTHIGKEKFVVFSSMLEALELARKTLVDDMKIKCIMYTGVMNGEERDNALFKFNNDETAQCLLISILAGGLGLNCEIASRAVVLDPNWNPQITLQAMCRVHRITSKKEVRVTILAITGTIEESILERAQEKQKMSDELYNSSSLLELLDKTDFKNGGGPGVVNGAGSRNLNELISLIGQANRLPLDTTQYDLSNGKIRMPVSVKDEEHEHERKMKRLEEILAISKKLVTKESPDTTLHVAALTLKECGLIPANCYIWELVFPETPEQALAKKANGVGGVFMKSREDWKLEEVRRELAGYYPTWFSAMCACLQYTEIAIKEYLQDKKADRVSEYMLLCESGGSDGELSKEDKNALQSALIEEEACLRQITAFEEAKKAYDVFLSPDMQSVHSTDLANWMKFNKTQIEKLQSRLNTARKTKERLETRLQVSPEKLKEKKKAFKTKMSEHLQKNIVMVLDMAVTEKELVLGKEVSYVNSLHISGKISISPTFASKLLIKKSVHIDSRELIPFCTTRQKDRISLISHAQTASKESHFPLTLESTEIATDNNLPGRLKENPNISVLWHDYSRGSYSLLSRLIDSYIRSNVMVSFCINPTGKNDVKCSGLVESARFSYYPPDLAARGVTTLPFLLQFRTIHPITIGCTSQYEGPHMELMICQTYTETSKPESQKFILDGLTKLLEAYLVHNFTISSKENNTSVEFTIGSRIRHILFPKHLPRVIRDSIFKQVNAVIQPLFPKSKWISPNKILRLKEQSKSAFDAGTKSAYIDHVILPLETRCALVGSWKERILDL